MKVKLSKVFGDQEDFADLIGTVGELDLVAKPKYRFKPDGRGDWLSMLVKTVSDKDGVVKISTSLGNTFHFKKVA